MFFLDRLHVLLLLIINVINRCFTGISPLGSRKESNEAFTNSISSLNLDSDDEGDHVQNYRNIISAKSPISRQPIRFTLSESDSDDESSFLRDQMSRSSGFGSDYSSSSIDQSDNDRSLVLSHQHNENTDYGTLIGLESPMKQKVHGYTPTLDIFHQPLKIYNQYDSKAFRASSSDNRQSVKQFISPVSSYDDKFVSFDNYQSPIPNGPLGSNSVGSLDELYFSPIGSFNLDRNLWSEMDRRYIKVPKPPLAPGTNSIGIISVKGFDIPKKFLQAIHFGVQTNNKALSNMKWKKTFISGNSATVYGIELNDKNLILKIAKHNHEDNEIPQCVHRYDIESLHKSSNPCKHIPKYGLIHQPSCSADFDLVPLEYYVAEKVARTNGLMPAASSIPNTFAKDINEWYLIFEELPGISPLKYGENILERLAKPLIRQQLEALKQIANCHIMHLDAHWGNVLYSRERGIQLIDFGLAALIDRFELPNNKATLIVTFTLSRCLDCRASQLGRDFENSIKNNYPIDGQLLLSHPWLQY